MPLDAQMRLNKHLMEWSTLISRFDATVREYLVRKAEYEHRVAVVKVTEKSRGEKVSLTFLDTLADADQEAHTLHLETAGLEGTIAGMKARLTWCAAMSDALRSEVSTERAEAQLYTERAGA